MDSDNTPSPNPSSALLAVDLGLRTGLAVYDRNGRLQSYSSRNFGSRERLKRGAEATLRETGDIAWLIVEGDAALGRIWARAAERRGAQTVSVPAERWREALLHPSERRSGVQAKRAADTLAKLVISWSGLARPTALRHDAAEAILAGLWGCLGVGLLAEVPPPLRLQQR